MSIDRRLPTTVFLWMAATLTPAGACCAEISSFTIHGVDARRAVAIAERVQAVRRPRWTDEGLAMLFDSILKQAGHESDFRRAQDACRAFPVADIMALEQYPASPARQRVFYGQAAALVRWLIARGRAANFVDFVDDASRADVATALQRHYGLESLASLDAAWKEVPPIQTLTFVGQVR